MSKQKSFEKTIVEVGRKVTVVKKQPKSLLFPKRGDLVSIHYKMTAVSSNTIIDDTWDKGLPLSFRVGHAEVIQGLDEAILTMCLGERAKLNIASRFAFGTSGLGRYVPPNTDVFVDVELVMVNDIKRPFFKRKLM